jgi:hypothetical protein
MSVPEKDILSAVTLAFATETGFRLNETTFEGLTAYDLGQVIGGLHARNRLQDGPARRTVKEALDLVRSVQREHTEARVEEAVREGLGRWLRWLPLRVTDRITAAVMVRVGWVSEEWAVDFMGLRTHVAQVEAHVRRLTPPKLPVAAPADLVKTSS